MPILEWDQVGDRVYETGLDKGVLYLPDGSAVPWNGLTEIVESFDDETQPVYFDGMKINDLVVLGDFSATMKAITYPDEFVELEGLVSVHRGVFGSNQRPKTFALCYRIQVGNDFKGDTAGYKLHILYNVTAVPNDKTYATMGSDPSIVEFEWKIVAVPQEVPGIRPTAHFVIDSRNIDPWLLEDIEKMLYGSTESLASLVPMPALVEFINTWFRVKIVDNGDGTWTATSQRDGFITFGDEDFFQITKINSLYLDEYTFEISDTVDIFDVPLIKIIDNENGTWTASSDDPTLIIDNGDGTAVIFDANILFVSPDSYQISNTMDDS